MVRRWWSVAKTVFSEWSDDEAPRMGAALAFYTILSLSPLLLLLISILGLFIGHSDALQKLTAQLHGLLGPAGDQVLNSTVQSAAQESNKGWTGSLISFLVLLFSASGVFGELRTALNKIWDVKPEASSGIWSMVRERLLSFGMVLSVGFLLVASLIVTAALSIISGMVGNILPIPAFVAVLLDLTISIAGVGLVFALLFRYVPAAPVRWRNAVAGGFFTSVLFTVGRYVLGVYLSKAAVGSAYGAAGSVVVVIVWIYYTAQIVFFGAELTHVLGEGSLANSKEVPGSNPRRPLVTKHA